MGQPRLILHDPIMQPILGSRGNCRPGWRQILPRIGVVLTNVTLGTLWPAERRPALSKRTCIRGLSRTWRSSRLIPILILSLPWI